MKKAIQKYWWIAAVVILAIAAVVVVLMLTKQEQPAEPTATQATTEAVEETIPETTAPVQTEEIVEETETATEPELVQVEVLNYEFTLSGQLAEKVFFREVADTDAQDVEAYTKLGDREYTLFILVFGSTDGDIVHMLGDAEEKQPVAFIMSLLPENMSDEAAKEFYTAQGAVNNIMDTLKAK